MYSQYYSEGQFFLIKSIFGILIILSNYFSFKYLTSIKDKKNQIVVVLIGMNLVSLLIFFYGGDTTYSKLLVENTFISFGVPLSSFLFVVSYVDFHKKIVPNKVLIVYIYIYIGIMIFNISLTGLNQNIFIYIIGSMFGSLLAAMVFFTVYFATKRKLGAGDVKFAIVLGAYMHDTNILSAIFLGVLACCIFSMIACSMKKLSKTDTIALTPFLSFGSIITIILNIIYR